MNLLYRSLPLLLPRPQLFPLLRPIALLRSTLMTHQLQPTRSSLSPTPPTPPPTKRRCLHTPSEPTTTMSTTAPRIELTPTEETVRRLLLDVSAEIDTYNRTTGARNKDPVILRFTGGWVRDKLLGIPSHDIDVGISRMTGYNFGLYLADFLQRHYDSYGIEPGAVHRIESNPEKSKHLETATMKVLGLDIDLVNLRSEVYKGDSRVPIMEFGTPEQDAHRRDCTVNALFYNLHTCRVEDFTEHGLEDMRNKIIRTPLPPQETFDDDPLRILRLIRFSSRLGFEIVPEAKEAMKLPDINDALRHKISRERIGDELHKMFVGPSPDTSLTLIHQNSLYQSIFAPPDLTPPPVLPLSILPRALAATRHLHTLPSHKALVPTQHETYLTWLLAALSPWQDIVLPADSNSNKKAPPPAADSNSKKKAPPPAADNTNKKAPPPAAAVAAREGLKLVNRTTDVVARAFRHLPVVRAMVAAEGGWAPARVGMFVKELGASWRSSLWSSEMLELAKAWPEDGGDAPSPECAEIISRYEALTARIVELGMEEAYLVKPLIDGNELVAIVGRPRGPWVSKALPRIIEWQWANPGAGKEQAVEWVKAQKGAL